ncbi:MAG: tetratricopeptide repeat protein [Alphaproteobacteria bacterium]|nr:tetratricopeptide repeat protein [Alphaproteobacteria bacterium]
MSLLLTIAALANPAPEEDPDVAMARLAPLVEQYPQDFALVLELAWAEFRAGAYEAALVHYRQASDLSGGAWDARLGEAWCLVRLKRSDARRAAEALRDERPADSGVQRLLAALPTPWRAHFTVGANGLAATDGPDASGTVRVRLTTPGTRVWGDLTVGGIGYVAGDSVAPGQGGSTARNGSGNGQGGSGGNGQGGTGGGTGVGSPPVATVQGPWVPGADELGASAEGWLRVHFRPGPITVMGVAGVLTETTGGKAGFAAGSRVTVGRRFRGALEGSWTRPPASELDLYRLSPSLWLPLGSLVVQPAGAAQLGGGAFLPSGELTVFLVRPGWALWAGGRVGTELHATELVFPSTVRWPEPVDGVGFGGLRLGRLDRTWVSIAGTGHVLAGGSVVPGVALDLETPL